MADTLQDVRNKVDWEGLDYSFRQYSSFPEVEDSKFHRLRKAYVKAANALEAYLNVNTVGEGDEDNDEEE